MLLAVVAVLAGAVAGWLAGRRPPASRAGVAGLAGWKLVALVPAGAALLLIGTRWVGGDAGIGLMAAGYGALTVFAAVNHARPGLILIAVGLLANLVVTVVDHGMPVRDIPAAEAGGHHHGVSGRDHLTGWADTIRIAPLGETVSAGDLLVAMGGAVAIFFWLEPAPAARRSRRHGAAARHSPGPGSSESSAGTI